MSHASQAAEPEVRDESAQLLLKAAALQEQATELFEEGRRLLQEADQLRARARGIRQGNGPAQTRESPSSLLVTKEACRLTRQQCAVAALVARGCTNKQIARELTISEGTAANHVRAILLRLDLQSRAQIAVWAVRNGLFTAG